MSLSRNMWLQVDGLIVDGFANLSMLMIVSLRPFWRAEEERVVNSNSVGERRFLLTLRNQPFLLKGFHYDDGLYRYRMKMHDVIVNGDGTGGPIGRVFQNNRMEYTPNVSYYSDNEYPQPQRDIAKSCGIKGSLVLLWRDCNGGVVGAIEFVSLEEQFLDIHPSNPLRSNSPYSDYCIRLCGQYDSEKDSLISAVTEINEVIRQVCERGDVVRWAQTWMLCKLCNSLSTVKRCVEELKSSRKYFTKFLFDSTILEYQDSYNLKKGEGVVGKVAESSHDLVYCEDVAKLSITEYPLAHVARYFGLSASFAIRLKLKSNETRDQIYVLGFFLYHKYVNGKNLRATLVPILETMRQCFKTFKFASGGEIGGSLSVQVIDANSPDRFETFEIGALDSVEIHSAEVDPIDNGKAVVNTTEERDLQKTLFEEQHKSFAVSGDTKGEKLAIGVSNIVDLQQAARNGNLESMVSNIDETNVQTATQTYADERGRDLPGGVINFVHTDRNDVGFSDECFTSPSKLANERGGIDISLEELMQEAGKNREDAAKNLNVGISTLKRACRHHGISRSPPRKRNLDNQSCSHNSTPTSTRKTRKLSAPAVQNQSSVKIKAKYKDICIKFDISASSGIDVFHYEVSKRLKLVVGDYTVKYQDEDNDWIIIACDDDLRDYICSPTLLGKNNLVISLEPV